MVELKIIKFLFYIVAIIILSTIISAVKASPVFSEKNINVYMNDGESKIVTTTIYDLDKINIDNVILIVSPHPDYMDVPTHIKNIKKTIIDDNAMLIEFELFLPSSQDIGFHREIITLNNQHKLNIAISNDIGFVASLKDFSNKDISIGEKHISLVYPFLWLIILIIIIIIALIYRGVVN